jgi:hypothetical protein
MSQPFPSLTLYRLREEMNGRKVKGTDDFVDLAKKITTYSLQGSYDFDARLYVSPPDQGRAR